MPYAAHPLCGLRTRSVDAGLLTSFAAGRTGRRTSSPPQFGHRPPGSRPAAHAAQKVHSNEQINASGESGGRSRSQHSQLGLSASTVRCPACWPYFLPRSGAIFWQASTSAFTEAADFSNSLRSEPFSSSSTMRSTPFAPITTGTPT